VSAVLVFFCIARLAVHPASKRPLWRVLLIVFASAYLLVNWLLAVSYFTQAAGFNDELFFHLNADSLRVGWATIRLVMIAQFAALGLLPLALGWATRPSAARAAREPRHTAVLTTSLLLAAGVSYPTIDLGGYLLERRALSAESSVAETRYVRSEAGERKNIILIYAESLEATYFDTSLFRADLLPRLTALKDEATVFSEVRQRPGTGWTVAGIVASQCGFSVQVRNPLSGNTRLAATPEPYPSAVCLGDVAKHLGYQTLFLGGADSAFAGKGNFLRTHGFDRVLGRQEITAQTPGPLQLSGWGVHDDDLFSLALDEIELLESHDEPYFLSLLTLDTHHPNGYPSAQCPQFASGDPMERALACTDAQIADFIAAVRARSGSEDTVIGLFSDHLAMRNSLWETLSANQKERRLLFMLFDGEEGEVVDTTITHYDVGPILLEAAGAASDVRIGFGQSLALIKEGGTLGGNTARPLYAEEPQQLNAFRDGLALDSEALVLRVGDTEFPVSENGGLFVYGVYMLIFDDDGDFLDVLYARKLDDVRASAEGRLVAFVERLESELATRLYVGRLRDDGFEGQPFEASGSITLTGKALRAFSD
jgi:phosphoglycerol transferase